MLLKNLQMYKMAYTKFNYLHSSSFYFEHCNYLKGQPNNTKKVCFFQENQ